MSPIDKLILTAQREVGYIEKATNSQLDSKTLNAGKGNFTKYARDLDSIKFYNGAKNGYSWCDMFVDWCFITTYGLENACIITCQPTTGGYGASCTQSSKYYAAQGRYDNNPQVGDQVFFNDGKGNIVHTGLVVKIEGGRVYTIEGNTSNAQEVVKNGGSVCFKNYPVGYSRISGYGHPNFDLAPATYISFEQEEEEEEMTLEQFKILYNEMRKELQDNDSSAYSQEAREWAIDNGLIQGNGTINGEPNYLWKDQLSREQFVTMLHRFAKMIGKA